MNKSLTKIIIASLITAAAFYAAYFAKTVKIVSPAPAHRILTLEYKAESAVTNQLHRIKTNKHIAKTQTLYQIMPAYSINLKQQDQGTHQLYNATLCYPHAKRQLLIKGTPNQPDQLIFP